MSEGPDRLIERVRETLRAAPGAAPDQRAVAHLLSKVWATPRPSRWRRLLDALRMPALSRVGALAVAGAALAIGFVSRGTLKSDVAPEATVASPGGTSSGTPVVLAANTTSNAELAAVPMQFVLDDRTARRVSIVGEFNGWTPGKTPLTRLDSGLWTVTVPLTPGRHVYAFVLDDTLVKADPRAPKVRDADYGREGSVVMVFAR
jgi:hypothetical protein